MLKRGVAIVAGVVVLGLTVKAQDVSAQPGPLGDTPTVRANTHLIFNESFGSAKKGATVTQIGTGSGETDLLKRWMYGQNGWLGCAGENISIQPDCLHIRLADSSTPVPPGFDNTGKPSGWGDAFQLTTDTTRSVSLIPPDGHSTYLEVREKLPKSPEAWPDIWLYCNHDDYRAGKNRADSELDVLETNEVFYKDHVFRPDMFVSTSHNQGAVVDQLWIQPGPARLSDEYHVYGCEIFRHDGNLQWRIFFDGKEVFASSKKWDWTAPAPTLILGGCAVVKAGKSPSVPDDGTSIDWVRIWQN